ncbi:conjugal transfer protein TraA [Ensifer sp. YR511]|uniref:conjugal transfer protein TraA n=1 Tax=Ensifer sp. YR511 TaxID=1855294 RepID=UPI001FCE2D38|nr:conjugal transfer protein TraA [Ensifer sp. YR511]
MRTRFEALASGSQPAVVKMASFGGGSRLGAMVNYVSRNGEVVVENERGERLRGRDELAAVGADWDHLMKNRAESRDIGSFRIEAFFVQESDLDLLARSVVKRGFADRSFAYAVTPRADGNGIDIEGLVVLRSPKDGERLTGDDKASRLVQARFQQGDRDGVEARFRLTGYGNGVDYGTSRLRALVDKHGGAVRDEQGRGISNARQAGDLVQQEWRDKLHSRKPRDVMHLIMSARAGTAVAAFESAARGFLAAEFSGHHYVFAVHDPANDPKAEHSGGKRPHVHAHAIVVMRSDAGDRIETTIPAFRQWRVTMAEKARDHGINMEMTDRRERASAPAFGKNQVRPINSTGRTEHEGTSEAAERRYLAKRSDERSFAHTHASKAYTVLAKQEWRSLAGGAGHETVATFAVAQILRLETDGERPNAQEAFASASKNSSSQSRINLVQLDHLVSEGDDMRHMTRPEFEAYEKRVEMALFRADRTTPPSERADFEEIAAAAREHVNVRRELVALVEQRDRDEATERHEEGHPRPNDIQGTAQERDDSLERWNDAVSRHGLATVKAANQILVEIERAREAIERVEAGKVGGQDVRALKVELDLELGKAAELGAAGNTLIREVAEVDDELRRTLIAVERERLERERGRSEGREVLRSNERNGSEELEERGAPRGSNAAGHSQTDIRSNDNAQSDGREPSGERASGGAPRTDLAKQQVPRLEFLQREADERERDQDDRER